MITSASAVQNVEARLGPIQNVMLSLLSPSTVSRKKKKLTMLVKDLEEELLKVEKFSGEEIEKKAASFEERICTLREEITKIFAGIHKAIDKREKKLMQELEEIQESCNLGKIANNIKKIEEAGAALEQGVKVLSTKGQLRSKMIVDKIGEIESAVDKVYEIETEIVSAICKTETVEFSSSYDDLIQRIESFGKIVSNKVEFVPSLTVNEVTDNTINVTCASAPFDKASYQIGIGENDETVTLVYTGESTAVAIQQLKPDTDYHIWTQVGIEGIWGSWYRNSVVRTKKTIEKEAPKVPNKAYTCEWKLCPKDYLGDIRYYVDRYAKRIATKISSDVWCAIIGNTSLPPNGVTSWSIRILNSWRNYGNCIYIGVAPSDIDQNEGDSHNKCGWYFYCRRSTLYSGLLTTIEGWSMDHGKKKENMFTQETVWEL